MELCYSGPGAFVALVVNTWRSTIDGDCRIQVYSLCTTGERPSQSSAKCSPLRLCVLYYWRSMCVDNHHCTETQLPVYTYPIQYYYWCYAPPRKSQCTPLWIRFHSTCTRTDENGGCRRHQQRPVHTAATNNVICGDDRLAGWQCLAAF